MAGKGSFLARVMQYVVNELLVDRLANNPSFQRFAVRSSKKLEELSQKGQETKEEVADQLKKITESLRAEISRNLKDSDKRF